jgi:hypothetical protein
VCCIVAVEDTLQSLWPPSSTCSESVNSMETTATLGANREVSADSKSQAEAAKDLGNAAFKGESRMGMAR